MLGELGRLGPKLLEALSQPVGGGHVLAAQRPQELDLVVARDAQRRPFGDHAHYQAEHGRGSRPTID